jgi:LysM repeat protein
MKESIKAKLFAKHMKEDQSFKSAQVIEANAFDLGKTVPDASMTIRGGAYPSLAARIKGMATAAKGIAGTAARGLAKGFGNPVTAGALIAAEPTPANAGENEFARQKQYGAKPAASTPAANKPATSTTSKPAATPATPKTSVAPAPAPKPAAAPAAAPKPAPAPVPQTQTTSKSGFYKGGSMGDVTVKKGQTLSGIAKSTGQSVADLAKMNNIKDVNKISSGAKLMTKVPTPAPRPAETKPYQPSSVSQDYETSTNVDGKAMTTSSGSPINISQVVKQNRLGEPVKTQVAPEPKPLTSPTSNPSTDMPSPKPAPEQKKKEAGAAPAPAPVAECVQIGANKYRIV